MGGLNFWRLPLPVPRQLLKPAKAADNGVVSAKIAIASDCNLRCRYCFIDKVSGEVMSLSCARKVLEELIVSPGNKKRIGIYGGEPLLQFPLVRSMVEHGRALGGAHDKDVFFSIATNGMLLNEDNLEFFSSRGVHLAISCDGVYGKNLRLKRDGRGVNRVLASRLRDIFQMIPGSHITVLQGIHPQNVDWMFDNFQYLAGLGFGNFNFEIICGLRWEDGHHESFSRGFLRIRQFITERISSRNFLFLEPLNRLLLSDNNALAYSLEFDTRGNKSSIPYPFKNISPEKIQNGMKILSLRQELCRDMAQELFRMRASRRYYAQYIREAQKLAVGV